MDDLFQKTSRCRKKAFIDSWPGLVKLFGNAIADFFVYGSRVSLQVRDSQTIKRDLRYRGGVGRDRGMGRGRGVTLGVAVGDGVPVGVGVAVGLEVGVGVGVPAGVLKA
jgi:hypothetical protein